MNKTVEIVIGSHKQLSIEQRKQILKILENFNENIKEFAISLILLCLLATLLRVNFTKDILQRNFRNFQKNCSV